MRRSRELREDALDRRDLGTPDLGLERWDADRLPDHLLPAFADIQQARKDLRTTDRKKAVPESEKLYQKKTPRETSKAKEEILLKKEKSEIEKLRAKLQEAGISTEGILGNPGY